MKTNPSGTFFLHTSINMHTTDAAESSPKNHESITAIPKPTKISSLQSSN